MMIKKGIDWLLKNFSLKWIVVAISCCCLGYQTNTIWHNYITFPTMVKVHIDEPETNFALPSVSICTPEGVAVVQEKIRSNPNFAPLIDKEITDEIWNKERQMKYDEIARQLKIGDWFDVTLQLEKDPEFEAKRAKNKSFINGWLYTTDYSEGSYVFNYWAINESFTSEWEPYEGYPNTSAYRNDNMPVVESMPKHGGKCFTFFNMLYNRNEYHKRADIELAEDKVWAEFVINFEPFETTVANWALDYPPPPEPILDDNGTVIGYSGKEVPRVPSELEKKVYILVHPAGAMPSYISSDKITVEMGESKDIYVSKTTAILMEWPYITNCRNYGNSTKHHPYGFSHSDCIDRKRFNYYMRKCKQKVPLPDNMEDGRAVKRDTAVGMDCSKFLYLEKDDICGSLNALDDMEEAIKKLPDNCNSDCLEEYFQYEAKPTQVIDENGGTKDGTAPPNQARIRMVRKNLAEITYRHNRETGFVEFVCYLGGLLGLWLGLSMLSVYDYLTAKFIAWKAQKKAFKKASSKLSNSKVIKVGRGQEAVSTIRDIYSGYKFSNG